MGTSPKLLTSKYLPNSYPLLQGAFMALISSVFVVYFEDIRHRPLHTSCATTVRYFCVIAWSANISGLQTSEQSCPFCLETQESGENLLKGGRHQANRHSPSTDEPFLNALEIPTAGVQGDVHGDMEKPWALPPQTLPHLTRICVVMPRTLYPITNLSVSGLSYPLHSHPSY